MVGLSSKVVSVAPQVSGCTISGWDTNSDYTLSVHTYTDDHVDQTVTPPRNNEDTLLQDTYVAAYNDTFDVSRVMFPASFRVKRETVWDKFNASPEPVKKGGTITIKGRLRIADWTNHRYVGYTKRSVVLEFRTPDGTYQAVKTLKTGSGGSLATTVTATSDGYWRVRYAGSSIAGTAKVPGDFVDVE